MKTRTKYIAFITTVVGIVVTAAAYGYGYRYHDPQAFADWTVERISRALELDGNQRGKLNLIKDVLFNTHDQMHAKHDQKRQEVMVLLEQPTLDRQRALAMVQDVNVDLNQLTSTLIISFADFYDSLTPAQRQKVQDYLREREEGSRAWQR